MNECAFKWTGCWHEARMYTWQHQSVHLSVGPSVGRSVTLSLKTGKSMILIANNDVSCYLIIIQSFHHHEDASLAVWALLFISELLRSILSRELVSIDLVMQSNTILSQLPKITKDSKKRRYYRKKVELLIRLFDLRWETRFSIYRMWCVLAYL